MHVLMIFNKPENLGDLNQCRAVAQLLAHDLSGRSEEYEITAISLRARPRTRWLFNTFRRIGIWRIIGPGGIFETIFFHFFRSDAQAIKKPDIIVARLPSSEHAAVALKTWFQVPAVLVGRARSLSDADFDAVITTDEIPVADNTIMLETVPTQLTLKNQAPLESLLEVEQGSQTQTGVWCFLVGGGSAPYPFSERDYHAWVMFMEQAHRKLGIRWLVSTSRRTSLRAEEFLRTALDGTSTLIEATWWHDKPRKSLRNYIERATVCVVTAESESMLSDCVSFSKPVVAVRPDDGPAGRLNEAEQWDRERIERFLSKVVSRRRVWVCHSSELEGQLIAGYSIESIITLDPSERWDTVVKRELVNRGIAIKGSKSGKHA
jgi:mitochondrial fission protein ELM1